jgi:hypothetical protein
LISLRKKLLLIKPGPNSRAAGGSETREPTTEVENSYNQSQKLMTLASLSQDRGCRFDLSFDHSKLAVSVAHANEKANQNVVRSIHGEPIFPPTRISIIDLCSYCG